MPIQVYLNSLIAGSTFVLVAISFSLIYSTTRFFHFAHAVVFTSGAYLTFFLNKIIHLPISLSILLAIILCALFGSLMEMFIYRPLRRKNASSMIFLIASLGIYIVLQNAISLSFGDSTQSIRPGMVKEGINIIGARISPIQIVIIVTCILFVFFIWLWLKKSKVGKAMRAVANNTDLANITGINTNGVVLWTFAIGSAMAGLAGILVALDVDMTPTMGFRALLMGVIAVIIGGVGSMPGIVLGALLLGFAQNIGAWFLPSHWQDTIAFAIMLIFLLLRPQGFFGKPFKKAEI